MENYQIILWKVLILIMLLGGWVTESLFAQDVTGIVTDSQSEETLPGVNVLVKGTTTGTSTNGGGNYKLTAPSLQDTLVVSFIGYRTRDIPINGRSEINVSLQSQAISGEEMVVIGYGTQQKSDLTGSISSIGTDELEKNSSSNVIESLEGQIAGVDVNITSGRPGGSPNITIRGVTSISNDNSPLYVIDGVIIPVGDLQNGISPIEQINPGDIKSIDVLKDASATAIYGARGANGVLIITTKQGSREGGRVSYNSYVSMGAIQNKVDVLNSEEFLRVEDISYQNAKKYDPAGWANGNYQDPKLKRTDPRLFDENGNPKYNTDWIEEATRSAITHNQQISFSNGDQNNNYKILVGYHNEDGLLKESWLKRYNGRFDINSEINDWLTAGGFLNYNLQNSKKNLGRWTTRQLYGSIPISPVKFKDGSWAGNATYPGMEGGPNLIKYLQEDIHKFETQNATGNAHINIDITEGLSFKSQISTFIVNQTQNYYGGREIPYNSEDQNGIARIANLEKNSWQFNNQLNYQTDFSGIHSIKAVVGTSWENVDVFSSDTETQDFNSDFFKYNNLNAGQAPQPSGSNAYSYSLNSYFGRVNYTLKHKYLFTATGRLDGSSKFGLDNQYAFFPSGAIGWRISEENFMQNISFISNFKLRASYGITGSSAIPSYVAAGGLGSYTYNFNGNIAKGVGINTLANPDLQWEKNKQLDVGIDLGLFNDRITIQADVYRRKSENMLLNSPLPSTSGYSSVTRNIGSMENRGLEISLTTNNIDNGNFFWSTGFMISMNRNKVLKLTGGSDLITPPTIIREGEPINSIFGLVREGTWNTEEADEAEKYGKLPGDLKYKDINNDGEINSLDRVILGNGIADEYGSLSNTVRYRNFELSLDLSFSAGKKIYHGPITFEDRVGIANSLSTVLNAWTPENQDTPIAQLRPSQAGYSTAYTDADSRGIYDGSYIRGKNLQIAYNFSPEGFMQNLSINNLRIYASMQNFFVLADSSMMDVIFDPDQSNGGDLQQSVTSYIGQVPRPKIFRLGLNISF